MFKLTNPFKKKEAEPPKKDLLDIEIDQLIAEQTAKEIKTAQKMVENPVPQPPTEGKVTMATKHQGLKYGDKFKLDRKPTTTYLATMIFGNGSCEHLVVEPDILGFFKFKKQKYHINQKNCIWDANENTNRLFFHENYVEPLEIKEVQVSECENRMIAHITPENIDAVIKNESLRLIAEGPDLQKWVRISVFVSIAVLVLLLIICIVFLAQSGIFQQISGSLQGRPPG